MIQTTQHLIQPVTKIILLTLLLVSCANNPVSAPTPTVQTETPVPATLTPTPNIPVQVWLTASDQSSLLAQQPELTFTQEAASEGKTIYINENHHYQQMDGFGASMTDASAWLIDQLSDGQRTNVMNALFSPTEGIGVSISRIPMGASDFVQGKAYTYNDMPPGQTDPDLLHFSIEHDQAYIIPALQEALTINPHLKVMASPWSAPAWMKTSDALGHGSLRPEFYPAFANYFVKFIQAYAAEGIPIYAITIQNEPHHEPYSYPGMKVEAAETAEFVKNHLAPAFAAAGLDSKILIWDHNWDEYDYPIAVLDDAQAKAVVDGAAFHCYGGTVIAQGIVHDTHPDVDIYFTECSGGAWVPSFGEGLRRDLKDLVIGSTRYWAKTVIKWNLALDSEHGPHNGGCGNCYGLITITPETESGFTTNSDYYSIGHISKFVVPGAYRIASTSFQYEGLESVAFQNPDGSKALIVANTSTSDKPFTVQWGERAFAYTLPSGTVATFTWAGGEQQNPTIPARPTNLQARVVGERIILNWEFSPLAESYTIKRSETAGGPYTAVATLITIPEYFEADATAGTTYYYVVNAVNELGESSDSAEVSVVR